MADGTRTVSTAFSRFLHRAGLTAITACALVAGAIVAPGIAHADSAPIDPTEPASVTADALPTAQINGVAWAQAIIGDTVYVGGQFTSARPAGSPPGTNEVKRSNLLAYRLSTGELLPFSVFTNGQVRTLAASPDGSRLYIGGDFTKIGNADRNRVAALNPATGAVDPTFNPSPNGFVRAILPTPSGVYLGGDFTSVGSTPRSRAAAFSTSGALLDWAPQVPNGYVKSMAISPDASRVLLGGSFTSANGSSAPGFGLAMVASSGPATVNLPLPANSVIRDAGVSGAIMGMAADGDGVYVVGYDSLFDAESNFEGTARIRWSDGAIDWMEDCHGDSYAVYAAASLVYKASHAHDCESVPNGIPNADYFHALAFTKDTRGTLKATPDATHYPSFAGQPAPSLVNWFPKYTTGLASGQNQATWSVTGSGDYVVYAGEFLTVNGQPQQGLVRFGAAAVAPDKDGPRVTGDALRPTVTTGGDNEVELGWLSAWDRDNEKLRYEVRRNGKVIATLDRASRFYTRAPMTFVDSQAPGGQDVRYSIRVIDPFGNVQTSTDAIIRPTGPLAPTPVVDTGSGPVLDSRVLIDQFNRSVSNGWGTADVGQWKLDGPATSYGTSGGAGVLGIPAVGTATTARTVAATTSSDMVTTFSVDQPVVGGSLYASFAVREVANDDYRARLIFAPNGSVVLKLAHREAALASWNLGGKYSPGGKLVIRVQAIGASPTVLRAKVWNVGGLEPAEWQLSVTDSSPNLQTAGGTSVGVFVGAGSTGFPRTASYDSIAVTIPQ